MDIKFVSVQRIESLILNGIEKKLTIISSPAGYGKTFFLQHALENLKGFCWLDGKDTEIENKFLHEVQTGNLQDKLIVIDDYPEQADHSFHKCFENIVNKSNNRLHFVITCRSIPPISLARLRLQQLVEIYPEDLSLTAGETENFIKEILNCEFDKTLLEKIHQKSTGWIASLLIWCQLYQKNQDIEILLDQFNGLHPYITNYMDEEIFSVLSDEERSFLKLISLHDWVNEAICDLYRVDFKTSGLPFILLRKHLLLLKRTNYVLNPLFREFIYQQEIQQPSLSLLKLDKSIRWYLSNHYSVESINLCFKIRAFDKAAEIISENGHKLLEQGYHKEVLNWLEHLHAHKINDVQGLLEIKGLALIQAGLYNDALPYLEKVNTPSALKALAKIARQQGRYEAVVEIAKRILEQEPKPTKEVTAQILFELGLARMFTGKFTDAEKSLSRAAFEAELINNLELLVLAKTALSAIYQSKGNYDLAIEVLQQALNILGNHESESAVFVRFRFGELYLYLGELDKATAYIEEGLSLGRLLQPKDILGDGHAILANIARLNKDFAKAVKEHYIAAMVTQGSNFFYEANLSNRMLVYLATGEYSIVECWIEENGLKPEDAYYSGDESYLVLARYLLHTRRTSEAVLTWERIFAFFQREMDWKEGYLHILPWLAFAYYMDHKYDQANKVFLQALDLTITEGHLRSYLEIYAVFSEEYLAFTKHFFDHPASKTISKMIDQYDKQSIQQVQRTNGLSHPAQSKLIEIRTFGGLHVYYGGMEVADQGWRTEKTRNLIAYFAVHHQKAVPVEILLDDLWRDRSEQKSRRLLHTTLYYLKKALLRGTETLDLFNYQAGSYRINPEHFWIDLKEFDDLVKNPEDLSALNLAAELAEAGSCLYGIYDDWAIEAQNRYQVKLINLYQEIASRQEKAGSLEKAVYYARKIIDLDPLHEQAAARLMEWDIRLGNRTEAIRVFQKLDEQMMDELGAHPGEAIQKIYRTIMA